MVKRTKLAWRDIFGNSRTFDFKITWADIPLYVLIKLCVRASAIDLCFTVRARLVCPEIRGRRGYLVLIHREQVAIFSCYWSQDTNSARSALEKNHIVKLSSKNSRKLNHAYHLGQSRTSWYSAYVVESSVSANIQMYLVFVLFF